ncbi:MAG TPA: ABC transporter ATP-binding protein, partial [Polyangiaceae bacterium]|nr:ABC transporter ATP-binding protein [Polyangiaceae bacterium]
EAPAIRVRHLSHRYGAREVLRDVSFDVAHGEIFGFIGPNGAGKTTTIRVMATLLEPATGRVEIDGFDVSIDPDRVRRAIGYMPDHAGVYDRITLREFLEFFADSYQVPDPSVVDVVLELTDLKKLDGRLVAELSKGMKQRLQVARILLHDPKVLILDEPASDLDPRARIELRDLLLELRDLGKTIFLSSHILTELSDVCTSVGILERGQLVVAGPIAALGEELARRARSQAPAPDPSAISGAAPAPVLTPGGAAIPAAARRRLKLRVLGDSRLVVPLLSGGTGVHQVDPAPGGALTVDYTGDERFVAEVVRHLVSQGVGVIGVEPERNELERIFLEVTRGDLQ